MGFHDKEHVDVFEANDLVEWLKASHEKSTGAWVVFHKKGTGRPAPTYDEIVRALLCFGWIDSVPGKVDERRVKLYVSPRKPNSAWSASNKVRVEELISSGLMEPGGMAAIEIAKANGSWSRIDSAQNAEVPDDLLVEFTKFPGSQDYFDAFPRGVRKQILEWISLAKTETTRSKRVEETARLASQNIRANQWRPKNGDA